MSLAARLNFTSPKVRVANYINIVRIRNFELAEIPYIKNHNSIRREEGGYHMFISLLSCSGQSLSRLGRSQCVT
jgi:hypothetical protein